MLDGLMPNSSARRFDLNGLVAVPAEPPNGLGDAAPVPVWFRDVTVPVALLP